MSLVCPTRVDREYADRVLEGYVAGPVIQVVTGIIAESEKLKPLQNLFKPYVAA